jgi:hypothetical protein
MERDILLTSEYSTGVLKASQVHDNAMDQAFRTRLRLPNDCVIGMTVFCEYKCSQGSSGLAPVEDDLKYAVKDHDTETQANAARLFSSPRAHCNPVR